MKSSTFESLLWSLFFHYEKF